MWSKITSSTSWPKLKLKFPSGLADGNNLNKSDKDSSVGVLKTLTEWKDYAKDMNALCLVSLTNRSKIKAIKYNALMVNIP
jgi:hypothetical protein